MAENETKGASSLFASKRAVAHQLLRYSVAGLSAFAIDVFLLWLLAYPLGINYLLSNIISYTVSVIYNYILSVRWVYNVHEDHSHRKDFTVFSILSVIGLSLNSLLLYLLVDFGGMMVILGKLIATGIVTIYNYFTRKYYFERWTLKS